jgi:peptidoglycan/LPS O-acetylase OafA/YrhL
MLSRSRLNEIPRHFVSVDVLRFFAALAVMFYHLLFLSSAREGRAFWVSGGVISLPELAPYSYWGWVGVQIFFVISGFVISISAYHSNAGKFLSDRIVRLGPGAWICASLCFLLDTVILNQNRWQDYLRSIFFEPFGPWIDPVYWTLGIEVFFYGMVFLLLLFKKLDAIFWLAVWIGAASCMHASMQLSAYLLPEAAWTESVLQESRWRQLLLIQHGCFFAIGVLLSRLLMFRGASELGWLHLFLIGGCIQIAVYSFEEAARNNQDFSFIVPVAVWLLAMLILMRGMWLEPKLKNHHLLHKFSRSIGLMTYPLYLVHLTFGGFLAGYLVRNGLGQGLAVSAAALFCLAMSWFIAVYMEPPLQQKTKHALQAVSEHWSHRKLSHSH